MVGRLKDGAGDFVERLGKFLQDPKSTSVQPDEILANVLGVVAAHGDYPTTAYAVLLAAS